MVQCVSSLTLCLLAPHLQQRLFHLDKLKREPAAHWLLLLLLPLLLLVLLLLVLLLVLLLLLHLQQRLFHLDLTNESRVIRDVDQVLHQRGMQL